MHEIDLPEVKMPFNPNARMATQEFGQCSTDYADRRVGANSDERHSSTKAAN
ncbi:hypothetical protein BCAR13_520158 [Paraburkholderia caribensis]|nr:hypothetical protein BCAR13_520158 [Paraburkholderia caribensis]